MAINKEQLEHFERLALIRGAVSAPLWPILFVFGGATVSWPLNWGVVTVMGGVAILLSVSFFYLGTFRRNMDMHHVLLERLGESYLRELGDTCDAKRFYQLMQSDWFIKRADAEFKR